MLIITETIGQEALEHWALSFEHWYQDSQLLTLTFWIIQYHVISIVPFIRPWGNTGRNDPYKCQLWLCIIISRIPKNANLYISRTQLTASATMYPFLKTVYYVLDRLRKDDYVVDRLREDSLLRMYPSSRRRSTTYGNQSAAGKLSRLLIGSRA